MDISKIPFKTPYDGKDHSVRLSFLDENGDPLPSNVEQHHKDACDIDKILRQYDKSGLITHVNQATAHYGDYTEVNEYQVSLNMVMDAQNAFMELPSAIRAQFSNDPGLFFEFASNPENASQLVEMGLAEAPTIDGSTAENSPVADAGTEG
jgi:phage internal scaffolding protein